MSNFNKEQYVQTLKILFDLTDKEATGLTKCPVATLKGIYDSYISNAEQNNNLTIRLRDAEEKVSNV